MKGEVMTNIEKAQAVSAIVEGLEAIVELAEDMSTSASNIHRFIHEEMTEENNSAINIEYHFIRECTNLIIMIVNGSVKPNLEKLA